MTAKEEFRQIYFETIIIIFDVLRPLNNIGRLLQSLFTKLDVNLNENMLIVI